MGAHHHHHHDPAGEDPAPGSSATRPLRIGIGGPVGSGKTSLVAALCEELGAERSIAVVTNDIFTSEDAEALRARGVLATERIVAVETGCCPHTAIRDDISANLDAVESLERRLGDVELTLVESGGDNLTAIFSRALVDRQVFVIDTAGGDDIPRKGGPGIATADLLVINKTDLAPLVGSDVDRMVADASARRDGPVIATSITADRWCGRRRRLGAGGARRLGGRRRPLSTDRAGSRRDRRRAGGARSHDVPGAALGSSAAAAAHADRAPPAGRGGRSPRWRPAPARHPGLGRCLTRDPQRGGHGRARRRRVVDPRRPGGGRRRRLPVLGARANGVGAGKPSPSADGRGAGGDGAAALAGDPGARSLW